MTLVARLTDEAPEREFSAGVHVRSGAQRDRPEHWRQPRRGGYRAGAGAHGGLDWAQVQELGDDALEQPLYDGRRGRRDLDRRALPARDTRRRIRRSKARYCQYTAARPMNVRGHPGVKLMPLTGCGSQDSLDV